MLAAFLAGVPHRIHTVAGMPLMEASGSKRVILDWVEKLTYYCSTHVMPNSFGLKSFILEKNYTKASKVKVLGLGSSNGIETTYFNPNIYNEKFSQDFKEKLGIPNNDFIFLFVGRIVKDKGINELVEAFNQISHKYKNTWLLLVGPFEDELDPISNENRQIINSNSHILSLGYQKDVRPFFKIANVFVFPSYREGFPNVVMQAGAMGLPCIVSDINGCNEIIENGKNGLIIPPKNSQKLYSVMVFFITKSNQISWDSAQIISRIKNRYDRKKIWQLYLNFYNNL